MRILPNINMNTLVVITIITRQIKLSWLYTWIGLTTRQIFLQPMISVKRAFCKLLYYLPTANIVSEFDPRSHVDYWRYSTRLQCNCACLMWRELFSEEGCEDVREVVSCKASIKMVLHICMYVPFKKVTFAIMLYCCIVIMLFVSLTDSAKSKWSHGRRTTTKFSHGDGWTRPNCSYGSTSRADCSHGEQWQWSIQFLTQG